MILLIFGEVGPTWLLFPVWLCLFVLFVNGIATSLAILNVYARDLAHITAVALQLLFFLTPIIYPITLVPEEWHGIPLRTIVQANPLSVFIESLRGLVYGLQLPSLSFWVQMLLWSIVSVSIATIVYQRRGQDIGESI